MSILKIILVVVIVWLGYRSIRRTKADRKYDGQVSGGRSGNISLEVNGKRAIAEYEVGFDVDFIVYKSSLAWDNGSPFGSQDFSDFRSAMISWCQSRGSSFVIANDT